MKILGYLLLWFFAAVGVLGTALFSCTQLENQRSEFANYDEMVASGIVDRGWLPEFLPKSLTDIHESHDMDSNSVYATFKYDLNDTKSVRVACRVLVERKEGTKYLCPPFEKNTTIIILRSDGTGSLETERDEI